MTNIKMRKVFILKLCVIIISDIPVTETQTDTEMIDISKTHTETNTKKIFNTDTVYTYRNDRVKTNWNCNRKLEMTLKTDTEIICLRCVSAWSSMQKL